MKKNCFVYELHFSELEFKWSVHVIDALNQLHATQLDFLTVYNDLFLSWLRVA